MAKVFIYTPDGEPVEADVSADWMAANTDASPQVIAMFRRSEGKWLDEERADSSARETCNEARIGEIVANLEGGQSLLINRIGRDMWRVTIRDGLNHVSSIGEAPNLHDALAGARIP